MKLCEGKSGIIELEIRELESKKEKGTSNKEAGGGKGLTGLKVKS